MRRWALAAALLLGVAASSSAQLGIPSIPTPRATFAPITVLNMAQRNAGTYSFAGQAVQTGVIGAALLIDVSQATDPLPQLSGALEGSLDGGTTWTPAGAFSRPAGNRGTDPKGVAVVNLGATFLGGPFWQASGNANRQLRGSATLGGAMRFALTVTPQ